MAAFLEDKIDSENENNFDELNNEDDEENIIIPDSKKILENLDEYEKYFRATMDYKELDCVFQIRRKLIQHLNFD